jgi:hypothetical protein
MAFRDHFKPQDERARLIVEAGMRNFSAQWLKLRVDVPVVVKDLSQYSGMIEVDPSGQLGHFHAPHGKGTHNHGLASANGPMGLFWWSFDSSYRVQRAWIEIHSGLSQLDSEVTFIAEAVHAIDMCSPDWTDEERGWIYDAYLGWPQGTIGPIGWHYRGEKAISKGHGWFGPQGYWDTPGESLMVAGIRAATPYAIQDWWSYKSSPMVVDLFRQFITDGNHEDPVKGNDVQTYFDTFLFNISKSTLYAKWRASNPGEASRWDKYVSGMSDFPKMVTPFGRALVNVEAMRRAAKA